MADCWDDMWQADQPTSDSGDPVDMTPRDTIAGMDWAALATVTPTRKAFVIPRLAPAGQLTLFTGPGSAGKSLFMQQVCAAMAAGVPTLGMDMGQGATVYLSCEDDTGELHFRQDAICKALGVDMISLAGRFTADSLFGRLDNVLGHVTERGIFVLGDGYDRIAELVKRTGAKLICLDNVAHLFAGNENDRAQVTQFVSALNRLAGETGAAIVLLAHTNKAFNQGHKEGNSHSGSTAWVNAVRSQFVIEHDEQTDLRTITLSKANYAAKGEAVRFAWQDWAFVLETDLSPDAGKELASVIRANGENAVFLRCLTICTDQRRNVSHQPGSNYAPKTFAGMPEAKGTKAAGFAVAMERLLHLGQIELDVDLWEGANRHQKRGIRTTAGAAS